MEILIVGCGRVGARLAIRLAHSGHNVAVIDLVREAFTRLGPDFSGATYQGSALDNEVLCRAHAGNAEVVFALTGGDNRNLMIAQQLQLKYNVKRAVARLHDPVRSAKYREMGVETMCTTTLQEGLLELYLTEGGFPELPGAMSVSGDASALDS